MSFLISRAEGLRIGSSAATTIVRAHRTVAYPNGSKVPLVLDRTSPSEFAIQIIGSVQTSLGAIDDARAREAGFRDRREFLSHWNDKLYGEAGIDPSGDGRKVDGAPVVIYRFRKTDYVRKKAYDAS